LIPVNHTGVALGNSMMEQFGVPADWQFAKLLQESAYSKIRLE